MLIKLNYKIIAVIAAVVLTVGVWSAEIFFDNGVSAEAATENTVELPVLMYHQVLKDTNRIGDYVITPAQLENDLKYIRDNGYTTVTAQEIIDFNENGGALPEKPIFITFDDGYETGYAYALPLLEQYNMHAVISIIGKHSDIFSKEPPPHHLSYSHLSYDQMRELVAGGLVEIGNHTYDMHGDRSAARFGTRRGSSESAEQYKKALRRDIGGLNDKLKDELDRDITLFAYPFGVISEESREVMKELGFKVLLTCEEKVNRISPNGGEMVILNRFNRAGKYSTEDYFAKINKK